MSRTRIRCQKCSYPLIYCNCIGDAKNAERYKQVRKLNPQQFTAIWKEALKGAKTFDELIDQL